RRPGHRAQDGRGRHPPGAARMPTGERTPTMRWQTVVLRWLRRVRGWWPDRNPLRPRCDRAEAALVTVLVAVFVAGGPLLALPAGRWAHDSGPAPGHAQRADWHQVPAVLRTSTIWRFAPSPVPAWARWTAPGGVPHTGRVLAPAGLAAGAVVKVWVDAAGRLAGPPAPPGWFGSRAEADGVGAVLLLAELLWGGGRAAEGVAAGRGWGAGDAEGRAIGPAWGGHACPVCAPGGAAAPPAAHPTRRKRKPRDQGGWP